MVKGGQELVFCALGGAGEIGMNLNLFGFGKPSEYQWIIVDIGVTFSDDNIPGIEVILPNPEFIVNQKKNLLGIVLSTFMAHVAMPNLCNTIYRSNS